VLGGGVVQAPRPGRFKLCQCRSPLRRSGRRPSQGLEYTLNMARKGPKSIPAGGPGFNGKTVKKRAKRPIRPHSGLADR
jgi:hypothetical protein